MKLPFRGYPWVPPVSLLLALCGIGLWAAHWPGWYATASLGALGCSWGLLYLRMRVQAATYRDLVERGVASGIADALMKSNPELLKPTPSLGKPLEEAMKEVMG